MSGLDFGEAPVVALSGTVFSDANDNGQKNVGESGLGGRTVRLYAAGSFAASQATDASGGFSS